MCFFFSFVPATIWLVIGFLVLFTASRAEGALRTFGRVLGAWALVIAVLIPITGGYLALTGSCPMDRMWQGMHAPGPP